MLPRGIFLTSEHPEETARFYRDVAGVAFEEVGRVESYHYWKVDDGILQLAIHNAKAFAAYAYPSRSESNLTHLYFHIDDQAAFLLRVREQGIVPHAVDDIVVTLVDPDGRMVMFGTA
jgi:hypothetical protein